MAKALSGYEVGVDSRIAAETRRLQRKVKDLESLLVHLQAQNEVLLAKTRETEAPEPGKERARESGSEAESGSAPAGEVSSSLSARSWPSGPGGTRRRQRGT
jgi:hypothetical protein